MRDLLPEAVRTRPKTPLGENVRVTQLRTQGAPAWLTELAESGALAEWVDPVALGATLREPGKETDQTLRISLNACDLAYWLTCRS
jgi:hypothetical protein